MKRGVSNIIIIISVALAMQCISSSRTLAQPKLKINPAQDSTTHDIRLSAWGPYSKRYIGISHLADINSGLRFDFTVCPGYYRNKVLVPNVLYESSNTPWEVNPEMNRISYRYQLEWKDQVYTTVTYYTLDSSRVLVEMKCVNNTDYIQNLTLNTHSFVDYPDIYPSVRSLKDSTLKWVNAVDYNTIDLVIKPPQYRLTRDGLKCNEVRSNESLDGSLLANDFGRSVNDQVTYLPDPGKKTGEGTIFFRYRVKNGEAARFQLSGICNEIVEFAGTGNFGIKALSCQFNSENRLILRSIGNTEIELDGFFISKERKQVVPQIVQQLKNPTPQVLRENSSSRVMLKYPDINTWYGMAWDYPYCDVREILNDELDIYFKLIANNNVTKKFLGNEKGHFTNLFFRPVEVKPHADRTIYVLLCSGTESNVKEQLKNFDVNNLLARIPKDQTDDVILPAGSQYSFGNQLLKAALLSNVVYPIYTQRQFIRHFTPGKWWNSLYTWDVGFISLGMAEVDIQKSYETINAYTTFVGNQSAYIHHGSPVPVQFYAFFELWNKTQSKELLGYMYPRLKQYYQFMTGETPTSTTRMPSNLLKTWDYFYNSGGWDDYPPQHYLYQNKSLYKFFTPVITTAQYIRVSKMMRLCASSLGLKKDMLEYDKQIQQFTNALQKYSWDEAAGYFSYVEHDSSGTPVGIMRYAADNSNFNMGLDGVSPLISGICTPAQQQKLIEKIFSDKHLWTPYGITAVDQSAAYFKQDGYWNGTVWMPHQWFLWKTMLDLGEGEKAFQIAKTGLDLWKRETGLTYKTFEHFISSSGRGAGWSQFSGLSSPILSWFASYYKIGRATTGFEVWIEKQQFNDDFTSYNATLRFDDTSLHKRCILICMNPGYKYDVFFNETKLQTISYHPGFLQINLPKANKEGQLHVWIHKLE